MEGSEWNLNYISSYQLDDCPGEEEFPNLPDEIEIIEDNDKSTTSSAERVLQFLSSFLFAGALAATL